jgi:hypothetical protein
MHMNEWRQRTTLHTHTYSITLVTNYGPPICRRTTNAHHLNCDATRQLITEAPNTYQFKYQLLLVQVFQFVARQPLRPTRTHWIRCAVRQSVMMVMMMVVR